MTEYAISLEGTKSLYRISTFQALINQLVTFFKVWYYITKALMLFFPLNLDAIRDIRETAEQYGKIMSMTAKSGHAYIEFQEASDCQEAYSAVCGKTFDEKIVFALFYPISLWNQKIYI